MDNSTGRKIIGLLLFGVSAVCNLLAIGWTCLAALFSPWATASGSSGDPSFIVYNFFLYLIGFGLMMASYKVRDQEITAGKAIRESFRASIFVGPAALGLGILGFALYFIIQI